MEDPTLDIHSAVSARYAAAAQSREESLCCPVPYNPALLAVIPEDVIARDYGCGDPARYVKPGETVLDLGSGGGKHCFMAAQVVGPTGRVIGVDMTDTMLALARGAAPVVAERVGYANVEFRRGRIEDLGLDLDALDRFLGANPVRGAADIPALDAEIARIRREQPLVADASVDVVVSNCVLNLVQPSAKRALFAEIHRVLRKGGRAVISDITADEDVPTALQADAELWSGCVSGALREDLLLKAFEDAGFYGIRILERAAEPWRTVEGIEFRSITVEAWKGKEGPCIDRKQAVVYKGPFREVMDDDGHLLRRGVRTAVCEKTFDILTSGPYAEQIEAIHPLVLPSLEESRPFPCDVGPLVRHARETKGEDYRLTTDGAACGPADCC